MKTLSDLSNLLHPRPLINHLSATTHSTMNVPKQHSAITPNNATVVHVSSNTSSNLLHPRPLINHLSATTHSTMNVPILMSNSGPSRDSSASSRHEARIFSEYPDLSIGIKIFFIAVGVSLFTSFFVNDT
jgi:hypothetical protein